MKGFLKFDYSQIWLNIPADDHQFGYITRLRKIKIKNKINPSSDFKSK
jgi:hypothetical protein